MPASLGFLLAQPPTHPHYPVLRSLLDQELRQRRAVYLYCLAEGVLAVTDPDLQALRPRGLRLFACSQGALQRQIPLDDRATFGGLGLLTDLLLGVDRFQALAPGTLREEELAGGRGESASAAGVPGKAVVITVRSLFDRPELTREAIRVAAGLAVARQFAVALALLESPGASWEAWASSATDAFPVEHLRLVRENDGKLLTVSTTGLGSAAARVGGADSFAETVTPAACHQLVSKAFAVIPF